MADRGAWSFAPRIWIAIVPALGAAFRLQLGGVSSAAVTVGILALPTLCRTLQKASCRFAANGVAPSIVTVAPLSADASAQRPGGRACAAAASLCHASERGPVAAMGQGEAGGGSPRRRPMSRAGRRGVRSR